MFDLKQQGRQCLEVA